jgi:long-chain acyl-CoA synthetase
MKTVIDLLREGARNYGDRPYLGEKKDSNYATVSFTEADRQSLAFAASLVLRGFNKDDRISILSEGRTAWVLGEFGLLRAGCISVPLSTKLSPEELVFRLDHSESRAIFVSENNFPKLAEILDKVRIRPVVVCPSGKTESLEQQLEKQNTP